MPRISNKTWKSYKRILTNYVDQDVGLQTVIWLKHIMYPEAFGEDPKGDENYEPIELKALVNYNDFRIWPINKGTPSGELDEMNCAIILSQKQLITLNETREDILNEQLNWVFDQALDRFEINGVRYIAKGDTQTAQAKDQPILFQVVLRREEYGRD